MIRYLCRAALLPAVFVFVACGDGDGDDPPPPPTVDRFVVTNVGGGAHRIDQMNYPRVQIEYSQNGSPRVAAHRSAPDQNHPGYVYIGEQWHGGPIIDDGQGLPGDRLLWGHTYLYKLQGFMGEGGSSDESQEFTLQVPDFHPPRNVQVSPDVTHDTSGRGNLITWDRIAVDEQDGKTSYRLYAKHPEQTGEYNDSVPFVSMNDQTSAFHAMESGHLEWSYVVRAIHIDYGWTRGSEEATTDNNGSGPTGPTGSVDYEWEAVSGFGLSDATASIHELGLQSVVAGDSLYIAIADDPTKSPVVHTFAGGGWTDLSFPTSIDNQSGPNGWMRLAAGGAGEVYFALRDGSKIYLYEHRDSAWDTNSLLADGMETFGLAQRPSDLDIAWHDGVLYAAVVTSGGNALYVHEYADGSWADQGLNITGDISQPGLTVLDGTLYMHWVDRSDGEELRVREYDGASWNSVIDWSGSVGDLRPQLALANGALNFMVTSGVYRRTDATSAENLKPEGASWTFGELFCMTVDDNDNIIVVNRSLEDLENQHPMLSIYDGTEWKRITGPDFSRGTWPTDVSALGNTVIYSFTEANDDSRIDSYRLTRQ